MQIQRNWKEHWFYQNMLEMYIYIHIYLYIRELLEGFCCYKTANWLCFITICCAVLIRFVLLLSLFDNNNDNITSKITATVLQIATVLLNIYWLYKYKNINSISFKAVYVINMAVKGSAVMEVNRESNHHALGVLFEANVFFFSHCCCNSSVSIALQSCNLLLLHN